MSNRIASGVVRETVNAVGLAIVAGEYPPGAVLPREQDLAERFHVGRNGLREAIKVLVGKGLVRTARRYGSRVCERSEWNFLDPDVLGWHLLDARAFSQFLRHMAEFRSMIEPAAALLAAERATPEERNRIYAIAKAMETASPEAAIDLDVDLHLAVIDATHNPLLQSFRRSLEVLLRANFSTTLTALEGEERYAPNPPIHVAYADAIRGGRPQEARLLVEAMLTRSHVAAAAIDAGRGTTWVGPTAMAGIAKDPAPINAGAKRRKPGVR
jgi:DNA-binding FadR family transcriptional regulator